MSISDIGSQPASRSDPGSTLVCVTTVVNTACCRSRDNNYMTNAKAGSVGEWYYPNGTLVPRPTGHVVDFGRVAYTHQVRLARVASGSAAPLGVYTCQVPDAATGHLVTANITLTEKGTNS